MLLLKIAWRGRSRLAAYAAIAALAAGIATAASVRTLLADFQKRLHAEAREWLGAGVAVHTKDEPLEIPAGATHVVECVTLARSANAADPLAVHLKAVDPAVYPLYGSLTFTPAANLRDALANHGALVSERLLDALRVRTGDAIELGNITLRIRGVIRSEPDRFAAMATAYERVIVAKNQIPAGPSLTHRLLFRNADQNQLRAAYPEAEIVDYRTADPAAVDALAFTAAFLEFIAIAALALALIAFHAALRMRIEQSLDSIAILRTLGARRSRWFRMHLAEAAAIALAGCALGLAAAIPLAHTLARHTGRVLSLDVHAALDARIAAEMVAWSLAIALLTAWPALREASRIPVMAVVRRQAALRPASALPLLAVLCFSTNPYVIAASLAGAALTVACVYLVQRAFRQGRSLPLRNLNRPEYRTHIALAALTAGSLLIAAIETGRRGVAREMLEAAPGVGAHNLILAGAGKTQTERILQDLAAFPEVKHTRTVPIAWLRLIEPAAARQMWFATCEDRPRGTARVSRNRARQLHLKPGDTIAFATRQADLRLRIASIGITNNVEDAAFGFVLACADLEAHPLFYFGGAQIEPADKIEGIRRHLARIAPTAGTLTASELAGISERALSDAMFMLDILAALAIAGGAVLLALTIAAAQSIRARELAILRALGASRRKLLRILLQEFLTLTAAALAAGAAAGSILASGAVSAILQRPVLIPAAPLSLIVLVPLLTATALAASLPALRGRPLDVLRQL